MKYVVLEKDELSELWKSENFFCKTYFQTYEWNAAWGDFFCNDNAVFIGVYDTSRLVGIVPVCVKNFFGFCVASFFGNDISDYIEIPGFADEKLFEYIFSLGVYIVHIKRVGYGSLLEKVIKESGYRYLNYEKIKSYCLDLTNESAAHAVADRINSNKVNRYKSKWLKLQSKYGAEFSILRERGGILKNIDRHFALHKKRWGRRSIFHAHRKYADFFRALLSEYGKNVVLAAIKGSGGENFASLLGMEFANRFYYYIPAYNIDYGKYSVGELLILHLIKYCIDNKFEVFDLMIGNEDYKKRFSDKTDNHGSYYIFSGRKIYDIFNSYYRIKDTLKKWKF